jgi:hypothetical protein
MLLVHDMWLLGLVDELDYEKSYGSFRLILITGFLFISRHCTRFPSFLQLKSQVRSLRMPAETLGSDYTVVFPRLQGRVQA